MTVDIHAQSAQVLAGAFLARATYGAEYIDPEYNLPGDDDAEKNDDYRGYLENQSVGNWRLLDASDLPGFNPQGGSARFTANGLYDARVESLLTDSFDAQGLLAVEGGNTLVLSFRGTDGEDPAVESGQAFTAVGIAAHYQAFESLIDAAHDYLAAHPEITNMVVSGHSLGGAMADVFALKDADRFRDLRPDGLTIVSLASSGIPEDLPQFLGGIDEDVARIVDRVILETPLGDITVPVIARLNLPADYISISNTDDRAHFPNDFPDIPEDFGLVPIAALKDNLQFGGGLLFDVPNIGNSDVQYYDVLEHPFDFRGMGAMHNSSLIWTNLQALLGDGLFAYYGTQAITMGVTNYNRVSDYDGSPIALFEGYLERGDPFDKHDFGINTLTGTAAFDYILGLAGNDAIDGQLGSDLLSGGVGNDIISGGAGNDRLLGGQGLDDLWGGANGDRFAYMAVPESLLGKTRDVIHDFGRAEGDKLMLHDLDAVASVTGNQDFSFIGGGNFTGEGQVRAVQLGADTVLRFNTGGTLVADMEILLKNVMASSFTAADFIL